MRVTDCGGTKFVNNKHCLDQYNTPPVWRTIQLRRSNDCNDDDHDGVGSVYKCSNGNYLCVKSYLFDKFPFQRKMYVKSRQCGSVVVVCYKPT